MNNKIPPPFALYIVEVIAACGLSFYGLFYIITKVFGAPKEVGLAVVVAIFMMLLPAIIAGLHIGKIKYYGPKTTDSFVKIPNKGNFLISMIIDGFIGCIVAILALLSVVYICNYSKYIIGICLGSTSIILSLLRIPRLIKILKILFCPMMAI
jgi:hypothetical protein